MSLYTRTWENFKPYLIQMLQHFHEKGENVGYDLNEILGQELERLGNRVESKYSFNIQYRKAKADNNLKGSQVARDLDEVIARSLPIKKLLMKQDVKLRYSNKHEFFIEKI